MQSFSKDLRVVSNLDLKHTLLVDDNPANLWNNLQNGVPILPFLGDPADSELIKLAKYLLCIADLRSVTEFNSSYFSLHKFRIARDFEDACAKIC